MTPDSRLKCSFLTVSNRLQTLLSVNRWLTIVVIACFSYTFQTREECVVHWYHYKKKEDHIKVRDSSLALYRRRVGGGGGVIFLFVWKQKLKFLRCFPRKADKKFGVFMKISSRKRFPFTYSPKLSVSKCRKPLKRFCLSVCFWRTTLTISLIPVAPTKLPLGKY